jgi:hypothetical protein
MLDGVACSVCDAPVPAGRLRLLAERDDLAFVEIDCPVCGSSALGFLAIRMELESDVVRLAGAPAITSDDVLEMHDLLEGWTGDLRGLLADRQGAHDAGTDASR